MVKAIIFLGSCVLAGGIMAQPNNVGLSNNLSNIFNNSNNDNNINVQQSININVQQAINVNKPKPIVNNVQRARRSNVTIPKPKPFVTNIPKPMAVNTQASVRRPTRIRRVSSPSSAATASTIPLVVQAQNILVQAPNEDNTSNLSNAQEFVDQNPQQQMIGNDFIPIQSKEENLKEDNQSEGMSISLPEFKKPQIYFSYADLSVTHKSVSIKKMISQKMLKVSRKHKAKHSGRIKRYITHNCCKWN